jgi:hypothetical protein
MIQDRIQIRLITAATVTRRLLSVPLLHAARNQTSLAVPGLILAP